MNNDPTSLDRLHDVALPPDISWWPLAPGWYFIITLLALTSLWLAWRFWSKWQANAYRRAALRELATMSSAPEIATLLRRTALVIAPRDLVAARTGAAWIDWLAAQCREPMPDQIHDQLMAGIYSPSRGQDSTVSLRDYAALWIARHQFVPTAKEHPSPEC